MKICPVWIRREICTDQAPFTSKNKNKKTKQNKTKQNKTKQNKTKQTKKMGKKEEVVQNSSKQICWWVLIWEHNKGIHFYYGLWTLIMDILARSIRKRGWKLILNLLSIFMYMQPWPIWVSCFWRLPLLKSYKMSTETGTLFHSASDQRWICKFQFFFCSFFSRQVQIAFYKVIGYKYRLLEVSLSLCLYFYY